MPQSEGISLADLFASGIGAAVMGNAGQRVTGVRHDSRACQPGDLFVAVRGERFDGTKFIAQAQQQGASAVLSDVATVENQIPWIRSDYVRRDLSWASQLVYGNPTAALDVIGVTGTNGKTTTTFLIDSALRALGRKSALMGTVLQRIGAEFEAPAAHTTAESDDIARFAAQALSAGCSHLVMEVSSHGLAQQRVDGMRFAVAAFTNLTQDHLDFHNTMNEYRDAKARLFTELGPRASVFNIDDAVGAEFAQHAYGDVWRCSARADQNADVVARSVEYSRQTMNVEISIRGKTLRAAIPLVGQHNLENTLVTVGCLAALGVDVGDIARALPLVQTAPGRLQRINNAEDNIDVLVDYAHTPDALQRVLKAVRPWARGRLIVVFGAGGNRDRSKRAPMGRAAAEGADLVVLTSDNPRNENPQDIIKDVEEGIRSTADANYTVQADRARAIADTIAQAQPGDLIVVAGKGHESVQIVAGVEHPFADAQHCERALQIRRGAH